MTAQYDKVAEEYPHEQTYLQHAEEYMYFSVIGDVAGKSILDIGCGRGEHARKYKRQGATRVVRVDVSTEMLRLAQEEEQRTPLGIEYYQKDMFVPQETFGAFDLVLVYSVLSIVPTKEKMLTLCRSIFANLKSGGRFITVGLNPDQDPATYPLTEKYGFRFETSNPRQAGDIIYSIFPVGNGKEHYFEDYYLSLATYEWAMREAGFQQVDWKEIAISPTGLALYGEGFWQDFINCRMCICVECVK